MADIKTAAALIRAAIVQYEQVLEVLDEDDRRTEAEFSGRIFGLQLALELLKAEQPKKAVENNSPVDREKEGTYEQHQPDRQTDQGP